MTKTYQIVVKGKVQGVGFRQSTMFKAIALGLKGFVKNQNDGSVLIVATGEIKALNEFKEWCKKGPRYASVEDIIIEETLDKGFLNFNIQ